MSEVRSEPLIFAYGDDGLVGTIRRLMDQYGVTFEIVTIRPVDASGFPQVRVCGEPHRVVKCLAECWNPGEDDDKIYDWANMMIGMEGAGFLWNHGLEVTKAALAYAEHAMEYYYPGQNYEEVVERLPKYLG